MTCLERWFKELLDFDPLAALLTFSEQKLFPMKVDDFQENVISIRYSQTQGWKFIKFLRGWNYKCSLQFSHINDWCQVNRPDGSLILVHANWSRKMIPRMVRLWSISCSFDIFRAEANSNESRWLWENVI